MAHGEVENRQYRGSTGLDWGMRRESKAPSPYPISCPRGRSRGSLRRAGPIALSICLLIGGLNTAMAQTLSPGTLSQERLGEGGPRYTLSTPPTVAGGDLVPLVISLHYGGPVSPWYGRGLLEGVVEPALRPLGAVIAAPDCPAPTWADSPCEQTVLDLISHLQDTLPVDPQRVVLTGYSKGGIGTWALAAQYPARFSAAIVMAGRPPRAWSPERWRLPMHIVHAREDEVLHLAPVQAAFKTLQDAGAPVTLKVVEGISHYETHRFAEPLGETVPWLNEVWESD